MWLFDHVALFPHHREPAVGADHFGDRQHGERTRVVPQRSLGGIEPRIADALFRGVELLAQVRSRGEGVEADCTLIRIRQTLQFFQIANGLGIRACAHRIEIGFEPRDRRRQTVDVELARSALEVIDRLACVVNRNGDIDFADRHLVLLRDLLDQRPQCVLVGHARLADRLAVQLVRGKDRTQAFDAVVAAEIALFQR
ncbi:MAG: hypothetical protein JF591_20680 [Lysobacter sp.]|nr:hypothetical protein [Lysobacter sp.]